MMPTQVKLSDMRIVDTHGAAEILGVGESRVRQFDSVLNPVLVGRASHQVRLYDADDVELFAAQRKHERERDSLSSQEDERVLAAIRDVPGRTFVQLSEACALRRTRVVRSVCRLEARRLITTRMDVVPGQWLHHRVMYPVS